jgi:uncharacterized protein (DUF1697 family)
MSGKRTTVFVGLLRGVNVGTGTKLPMADLRAIAEGCGFADVRTYVQSGNLVFRTAGSASAAARALRAGVDAAVAHLDPGVAVRTVAEMQAVVDHCPFDDTAHVHVTFLVEGATPRPVAVDAERFAPEEFVARGRETYLYLPNGMGRSKLAAALGRGGASADGTTRNWRTVTTLLQMAGDA